MLALMMAALLTRILSEIYSRLSLIGRHESPPLLCRCYVIAKAALSAHPKSRVLLVLETCGSNLPHLADD
jgi:hypothetical protein